MIGTNYKIFMLIVFFVSATFMGYVPNAQAQISLKLINPVTSNSDFVVNPQDIFDLQLRVDTAGQEVNAFSIYLSYDDSVLQVIDQDANADGIQPFIQGDFLGGAILVNNTHFDPGNSIDKFQLDYTEVLLMGMKTGEGLVATVQFKATNAGNTTISFDFDNANVRYTAVSIPSDVVKPDVIPAIVKIGQGGTPAENKEFTKISGDNQAGAVNIELAEPFVVMASENGNPLSGTQITFEVMQGGGSFDGEMNIVVLTNAEGKAQTTLKLGATPTTNTVKATLSDFTGEPLMFTATATPAEGLEYQLAIKSGDNQTGVAGYPLSSPLVVKVTHDENPAAGISVLFEVIEGGGKLNGGEANYIIITSASGEAAANLALGQTAGTCSVQASLEGFGVPPVTFSASAQPGPPHKIVEISGNNQEAPVETTLLEPFVVAVFDEFDNPIQAYSITFQIVSGGGNLDDSQSQATTTDSTGKVSVKLTLGNIAGGDSNVVHAKTSPPLANSPIVFKTSATPVATQIRLITGNNQTGRISEPLTNPFVVKTQGSAGDAVPNTMVDFQVIQGGGSLDITSALTDENGEARTILTLGPNVGLQNNIVEASIPNGEKVTFVASAMAGQAASLEIYSGDNQTCELESQLLNPLAVKVTDASGNTVENAVVVFQLASGDALLVPNNGQSEEYGKKVVEVTDILGEAFVHFKAKTEAGNVCVSASLEGGLLVEFSIKVNPGEPDTISEFSGNGQTHTVGKELPAPFVVIVRDKYANPVSGAAVSFVIKSGGKSLSVEATTTDEMGKGSTFLTLGEKAGQDNNVVKALATRGEGDDAIHLAGSPVFFYASSTPSEAVDIEIVSGNSQIGVVGLRLPQPFVVRALDQSKNPVSGVPIAFAIMKGDGSLSVTQAVTDGAGSGSTVLTLGRTARTPKNPEAGRNQVKASIVGTEGISVDVTADGIPHSPYSMKKISGDGQTGIVTNVLRNPFVVEITDKFGNPITEEIPERPPVIFTIISGGGALSGGGGNSVISQLDGDGRTSIFLTLGASVGDNIVQATAGVPNGSPQEFKATALDNHAISLKKSDGDNQTGMVGAKLPNPLEVTVLNLQGQPVSGQVIEYKFETGAGMFADGSKVYTTRTDSEGTTRATPILDTNIGVQEIRAYSPVHTEAAVLFTVNAIPREPTNLSIVSGDKQTGLIMACLPQPLTIQLTDAYSHPISRTQIIFEVVSGNGEIEDTEGSPAAKFASSRGLTTPLSKVALTTDDKGQASVLFTLGNVAGIYNHCVEARLEGDNAVTVVFKASAVAGQPVVLEKTGGDGQTGLVETTLPLPLIVTLKDKQHNPIPSHQINFEVIEGGGTVRQDGTSQPQKGIQTQTDEKGRASVLLTIGSEIGKNAVRAIAVGTPIEPVEFTASALPDTLNMSLTNTTEGRLSGIVGQPLVMPLTVLLQDRLHNPVSSAEILFEVTAGGGRLEGERRKAEGGGQVLRIDTDASGRASAVLICGKKAGVENNIVKVSAPKFHLLTEFKATALPGAPAKLEKILGDNQSGVAAQLLSQSLVVSVKDEFDNPVPDVQLRFTVKVGDGKLGANAHADTSLPTLSVKTGEDGWASCLFYVGTMAGDNNNAVEVSLLSKSVVSFIASTLADEVAKYHLTAGDGQVGIAGEPLPHPLVVTVTDKYDNPIPDVEVIFEVTAGDGHLEGGRRKAEGEREESDYSSPPTLEGEQIDVITDEGGQASATLILGPVATDMAAPTGVPLRQGNNLVCVTVPAIPDYPKLYFFASAKAATGAKLVKISGDNQTGTVGKPLQHPLVAGVFDSLGNPAPDTPVMFDITKGGGKLSFGNANGKRTLEAKTDLNGRVVISLTLSSTAGVDSDEVLVSIPGQQIRFTASAQADVPDELVKTSGGAQTGVPGLPLPEPFVVTCLDRFNNPVIGATVTFRVTEGGGCVSRIENSPFPESKTKSVDIATDDKGQTRAYLVLPEVVVGGALVEVSLPAFASIPPVTFSIPVKANAVASLTIVEGNGQHGTAGKTLPSPLVVFASDQFGNPIEGEPVDFEVIKDDGSLIPLPNNFEPPLSTATLTINTDSTGKAGVRWLLGTKANESNQVKATLSPFSSLSPFFSYTRKTPTFPPKIHSENPDFPTQDSLRTLNFECVFTATTYPSVATSLKLSSGNAQTGTVGAPLSAPLVVRVDDRFGNPCSGVLRPATVLFEVIAGDGKLTHEFVPTSGVAEVPDFGKSVSVQTDVNGQAKGYLILSEKAGFNNNAVLVTPIGFSSPPLTLFASTTADVAYSLRKASGDWQTTTVSTPLDEPIVVEATDRFGNPVEDVSIGIVLVSGDGILAAVPPFETDANGQASVIWTLGAKAGLNELVVQSDGLINSPLTFTATAKAGGQARLVKISGDKQIGMVGESVSRPLEVAVVDAENNPIEDAQVYFEVLEGLGTLAGGDCIFANANHRICHAKTDVQGRANTRLVLGHKSGVDNNIVEAKLVAAPGMLEGDIDTTYFKLTAEADEPAKLLKLKGDEQRGIAGATLLEPIVVIALDKYNNPVEDVIITFEAIDNPYGSGKNRGKLMLNLGTGHPQQIAVDILDVYTNSEGKAAAFYELPPSVKEEEGEVEDASLPQTTSRIRVYSPSLPINQLEFIEYPNTPPAVEFSGGTEWRDGERRYEYYGINAVSFEIVENDFLEFTAKAMDKDGDELTISVEDLPANSSFTPDEGKTSGKFRWRPSYTQAGTCQVVFIATDKLGSNTDGVATIAVRNFNLPPELHTNPANLNPFYVGDEDWRDRTTPLPFKAPEGTLLEIKFSAIDPDVTDTAYLAYSATPLPNGATMDEMMGKLRWRPGFNQAGEYSIGISVSDENGGSDTLPINITITDFNHPPELNKIGDKFAKEGTLLEFVCYATDEDEDQIRFKASGLPDAANIDAESGLFRWTPSFSVASGSVPTEHHITFIVEDSKNAEDSETIKITVEDVNREPVILPPNWVEQQSGWIVEGSEGALLEFTIEAFDPEDGAVELRATHLPTGAVFDSVSEFALSSAQIVEESNPSVFRTFGVFSWKPKYNQAGDYEITIVATDNISNVTSRQVKIFIENSNRAPEILYPSKSVVVEMSVAANEPLEFDIEAVDPDGDRLTCTATPLPENALLLSADGVSPMRRSDSSPQVAKTSATGQFNSDEFYRFSWCPTFQQAGFYEIDFTVSDANGGSDSACAYITVLDYNHPPQFLPVATVYVKPGEEASFQVSATDAEGNSFEYQLPNPPEGAIFYGTTTSDGANIVKFSWHPQQVGTHVITFIAQDAAGQSELDVLIIVRTHQWDINADNVVDIADVALVARNFGSKVDTPERGVCDINHDGQIDIADLVLVSIHLGESYMMGEE